MTTAFVLSGGASLGSIQVGMAQALDAEGNGQPFALPLLGHHHGRQS